MVVGRAEMSTKTISELFLKSVILYAITIVQAVVGVNAPGGLFTPNKIESERIITQLWKW